VSSRLCSAVFDARGAPAFGKNRDMCPGAPLTQQAPRSIGGTAPWPAARARPWRCLAIALALLIGSTCVRAESDSAVAEYRIKAAFLLKFLDFVAWPPAVADRPDSPIVIGVLGSASLGDALEQVAVGRQVNGHPVQVRILRDDESPSGLQMLFVGRAASGRMAAIAATADHQPILLVTESESALALGASINFIVVDDKVRFDISLRPAERAGLKISARLLAVARTVLQSSP
jgi:hypothetical protein